jgi:hypothetical protein
MTDQELIEKEAWLRERLVISLPDWVKMCETPGEEFVLMHQDAFAADYQPEEIVLLGLAVKYAGLCGKELRVIGQNRSTLKEEMGPALESWCESCKCKATKEEFEVSAPMCPKCDCVCAG